MRILAVEVGVTSTVAALLDDDAPAAILTFDGEPSLLSGVFLSANGTFAVGLEGARLGRSEPASYEPSPISRMDVPDVRLGDRTVPVRDLLAAVLVTVVAQARRRLDGDWPDEIRLLHPSGWDERRRQALVAALRRTRFDGPVQLVPVSAAHSEMARAEVASPEDGSAAVLAALVGTPPGVAVVPPVGGAAGTPATGPAAVVPPVGGAAATPPPGPAAVQDTGPIAAGPSPAAPPIRRSRRRRTWRTGWVVAGVLLVAAVVTTVVLVTGNRTERPIAAGPLTPSPAATGLASTDGSAAGASQPGAADGSHSSAGSSPGGGVPGQPALSLPDLGQSPTEAGGAGSDDETPVPTTPGTPAGTELTTVGPAGQDGGAATGATGLAPLPGHPQVGVLLPDANAPQWSAGGRAISADFQAAGISAVVANAGGSATVMLSQSEAMIASGVKVLVVAAMDDGTGRTIENNAGRRDIAVLDFGRLVPGGHAVEVVMSDDEQTGRLMGTAAAGCLSPQSRRVVFLDGPSGDAAAGALSRGARAVLRTTPGYHLAGQAKPASTTIDSSTARPMGSSSAARRPRTTGRPQPATPPSAGSTRTSAGSSTGWWPAATIWPPASSRCWPRTGSKPG